MPGNNTRIFLICKCGGRMYANILNYRRLKLKSLKSSEENVKALWHFFFSHNYLGAQLEVRFSINFVAFEYKNHIEEILTQVYIIVNNFMTHQSLVAFQILITVHMTTWKSNPRLYLLQHITTILQRLCCHIILISNLCLNRLQHKITFLQRICCNMTIISLESRMKLLMKEIWQIMNRLFRLFFVSFFPPVVL